MINFIFMKMSAKTYENICRRGTVIRWGELNCILSVLVEFLNCLHVLLFQVKG